MPIKQEELALFREALPVNSIPFLNRIREILDENKTNSLDALKGIESDKAKACLFMLALQAYGYGVAEKFGLDEFMRLRDSLGATLGGQAEHVK